MPVDAAGNLAPYVFIADATTVASGATRAAPTLIADGIDLSGATGCRVIVSAASGQTLSGAGNVRIWLWSLKLGRWVHDSQLDYAVAPTAATYRDDVSPDMPCYVGYGRMFAQVDGVTVSGGVITTQYEAGVLK